jgi:hypothetical protein
VSINFEFYAVSYMAQMTLKGRPKAWTSYFSSISMTRGT